MLDFYILGGPQWFTIQDKNTVRFKSLIFTGLMVYF